MAIDRTMRSNPLVGDGEDIEIEIENPESVSIETEDGGVILDFDPDASTLLRWVCSRMMLTWRKWLMRVN